MLFVVITLFSSFSPAATTAGSSAFLLRITKSLSKTPEFTITFLDSSCWNTVVSTSRYDTSFSLRFFSIPWIRNGRPPLLQIVRQWFLSAKMAFR